jgi:hypothetical protein
MALVAVESLTALQPVTAARVSIVIKADMDGVGGAEQHYPEGFARQEAGGNIARDAMVSKLSAPSACILSCLSI